MDRLPVMVKVTLARRAARVAEALRSLGGERVSVCGDLCKVQAEVPVRALRSLGGLPGAERVSLAVVPAAPFPSRRGFTDALARAPWPDVIAGWREVCPDAEGAPVVAPVVFVRGKRVADELLAEVRAAVSERFETSEDRRRTDLSVVVTGSPKTETKAAGIPIFVRREKNAPLPHWGLHPSVSWAIGEVACLRPGEVVVDPCAGVAALLVELARSWPECSFVGVERDPERLAMARKNSKVAGVPMRLIGADATAMPLPDESVDVVVSDLPFGRQQGSVEENASLYPQLLAEIARVLRKGEGHSRAVLFTGQESSHLLPIGAAAAGLTVVAQIPLKFGGNMDELHCVLFCLVRGPEASAEHFNFAPGGESLTGAERWSLVEKWRYAKPLLRPVPSLRCLAQRAVSGTRERLE